MSQYLSLLQTKDSTFHAMQLPYAEVHALLAAASSVTAISMTTAETYSGKQGG